MNLGARYPAAWGNYAGNQYVCVYQASRLVRKSLIRGFDPMHLVVVRCLCRICWIFDYFENYPFVAIYKDAKHGRCTPPGVGPWGFYYAGQDF